MAISLGNIKRGVDLKPPRLVIYGPHGVGKTTFGAHAPGAILLPLEDGIGALDVSAFPLLKTWDEIMDAMGSLYNETHDYQSAVVDSLDWLEPIVWAETCRRNKWKDIEEPGFGKGYIEADSVWREFFSGLVALREAKGMQVILLAHSEVKTFQSPSTEPYDRYQIKLQKRGSSLAQEWADAVFFVNYKTYTQKSDSGFNKKITRGVGTGERVLYTEERPSHLAKNRYGLPAEMPFSYQDFATAFIASTAPVAEQSAA